MKAPMNWLRDFTEIDIEPKEFAEKITISGSKVEEEEVEVTGDGFIETE